MFSTGQSGPCRWLVWAKQQDLPTCSGDPISSLYWNLQWAFIRQIAMFLEQAQTEKLAWNLKQAHTMKKFIHLFSVLWAPFSAAVLLTKLSFS